MSCLHSGGRLCRRSFQNPPILQGHHLSEFVAIEVPFPEDLCGPRAARQSPVSFDQSSNRLLFRLVREGFDIHHLEIAALIEISVLIEHVSDAAAHAGREFLPVRPSTTTMPRVMYSQP